MAQARPAPSEIRFPIEPRFVPPNKAARRLHLTLDVFTAKLPQLVASGFPAACPITGNFDLKAIDAWADRRSGLTSDSPASGIDMTALVTARLDSLGRRPH